MAIPRKLRPIATRLQADSWRVDRKVARKSRAVVVQAGLAAVSCENVHALLRSIENMTELVLASFRGDCGCGLRRRARSM